MKKYIVCLILFWLPCLLQAQEKLSVECFWFKNNSHENSEESNVYEKPNGVIEFQVESPDEDLWVSIKSDILMQNNYYAMGELRKLFFYSSKGDVYVVYNSSDGGFIKFWENCFIIGEINDKNPDGEILELCIISDSDRSRIIEYLKKHMTLVHD